MALSLHARVDSSRRPVRRVEFDVPVFGLPEEPPHPVAEAIEQHHKIRYFRGGPSKDSAHPNRGKSMRGFPFVQINPRDFINFLVVDVDRDDAEMWLLHPSVPEPHWIIRNPDNGHAQAGWMIEPVRCGAGSRERPVRYMEAVRSALESLTSSDTAFTRFLVRNPVAHSPAGDVTFGSRIMPYSLGELMSHMQSYQDPFNDDLDAWQPGQRTGFAARRTTEQADEGGRNNALFYSTRAELWRRFETDQIAPSKDYALAYATDLNNQLPTPLPTREVRELAYSAVRQVLRGKGKHRIGPPDPWLSRMGRKGGSATSDTKRAAAAQNATKATQTRQERSAAAAIQAKGLRALGHSLAAIARAVGKTIRTVQRYLTTAVTDHDITEATGSHGTAAHSPANEQTPPATTHKAVQATDKPLRTARSSDPVSPAGPLKRIAGLPVRWAARAQDPVGPEDHFTLGVDPP